MINTIIFDFGNVFINLDIDGFIQKSFEALKIDSFSEDIMDANNAYEKGLISTETFIEFYTRNFDNVSDEKVVHVWNAMLKDFPKERLNFLKTLKGTSKYKLILLSNTNELHINWVKENVPFYEDFKNCFDAFYLSHEIHLRKPDKAVFEFILEENNLNAEACLFIDDNKDNIETANTLNFKTWHINPNTEDVSNLFKTKTKLF